MIWLFGTTFQWLSHFWAPLAYGYQMPLPSHFIPAFACAFFHTFPPFAFFGFILSTLIDGNMFPLWGTTLMLSPPEPEGT